MRRLIKAVKGLREQAQAWKERKKWGEPFIMVETEEWRKRDLNPEYWKADKLLGELVAVLQVYEQKFETGDYELTGWGKPKAKRTRKGKKQ